MDGQTSDENSDVAPDDAFSMICGDLGLGENSRSSASLRYELEILSDSDLVKPDRGKQEPLATVGKECSKDSELFDSKIRSSSFDECNTSTKTLNKLKSGSNGSVSKRRPNSKSSSKLKSPKAGCEGNHCDTGTGSEFPTYADVPLGTSLRQQKKLYEQNLGSIIKKHRCSVDKDSTPTDGESELNKRWISFLLIQMYNLNYIDGKSFSCQVLFHYLCLCLGLLHVYMYTL